MWTRRARLPPHRTWGVTDWTGLEGVARRTLRAGMAPSFLLSARLALPSLWYGVYTPLQLIPTTLCSLFLLLVYPLHQINILGKTLYNQTVKSELPKASNIKPLGSRLCSLTRSPIPQREVWQRTRSLLLAQLPDDAFLKSHQFYHLNFESQTEMSSLRTIKAMSTRLSLEKEIPAEESDRDSKTAAS